jgi:hypothetical protein
MNRKSKDKHKREDDEGQANPDPLSRIQELVI